MPAHADFLKVCISTKLKLKTMKQDLLQKPQVSEIGKHIGFEAGEEMVKRFFDKYPEQAYGNIIGREILEKILSQPNCAGVSFLPGLTEEGERKLVLVGLDSTGEPIFNYNVINETGQIVSEEGIIADHSVKGWGGAGDL